MSILTQITLGRSQAAQLRLADAYAWHQALWKAFPGRDGDKRDFLFRIDQAGRDLRVLMLSAEDPEPPVWGHWQSKTVAECFLQHNTYRFQLRANPTMRRNSDRRRLGIYAEPRLRKWMQCKADLHGFTIADGSLVVDAPMDENFVKNGRRGKHVSVDFSGILTVKDRADFARAFETGIGSAKAFGYGLLMLQASTATR